MATVTLVLAIALFVSNLAWPIYCFNIRDDRDELATSLKYREQELFQARSKPTQASCQCSHGFGMHKDGGRCKAWRVEPSVLGFVTGADRCSCMKYTGPEPLPEYYHPLELS